MWEEVLRFDDNLAPRVGKGTDALPLIIKSVAASFGVAVDDLNDDIEQDSEEFLMGMVHSKSRLPNWRRINMSAKGDIFSTSGDRLLVDGPGLGGGDLAGPPLDYDVDPACVGGGRDGVCECSVELRQMGLWLERM